MACMFTGCYCKEFIQGKSKWSEAKCRTCSHLDTEHKKLDVDVSYADKKIAAAPQNNMANMEQKQQPQQYGSQNFNDPNQQQQQMDFNQNNQQQQNYDPSQQMNFNQNQQAQQHNYDPSQQMNFNNQQQQQYGGGGGGAYNQQQQQQYDGSQMNFNNQQQQQPNYNDPQQQQQYGSQVNFGGDQQQLQSGYGAPMNAVYGGGGAQNVAYGGGAPMGFNNPQQQQQQFQPQQQNIGPPQIQKKSKYWDEESQNEFMMHMKQRMEAILGNSLFDNNVNQLTNAIVGAADEILKAFKKPNYKYISHCLLIPTNGGYNMGDTKYWKAKTDIVITVRVDTMNITAILEAYCVGM